MPEVIHDVTVLSAEFQKYIEDGPCPEQMDGQDCLVTVASGSLCGYPLVTERKCLLHPKYMPINARRTHPKFQA